MPIRSAVLGASAGGHPVVDLQFRSSRKQPPRPIASGGPFADGFQRRPVQPAGGVRFPFANGDRSGPFNQFFTSVSPGPNRGRMLRGGSGTSNGCGSAASSTIRSGPQVQQFVERQPAFMASGFPGVDRSVIGTAEHGRKLPSRSRRPLPWRAVRRAGGSGRESRATATVRRRSQAAGRHEPLRATEEQQQVVAVQAEPIDQHAASRRVSRVVGPVPAGQCPARATATSTARRSPSASRVVPSAPGRRRRTGKPTSTIRDAARPVRRSRRASPQNAAAAFTSRRASVQLPTTRKPNVKSFGFIVSPF